MAKYRAFIVLVVLFIGYTTQAMVYDNRYLPLFQLPYVTVSDCNSYATTSVFMTTASKLFRRDNSIVGLPELWGKYDQIKVADALECVGKENLLLPAWRNGKLEWNMEGKLQTQGFTLSFEKGIGDHFFFGGNTMFMRVIAYNEFEFPIDEMSNTPRIDRSGDLLELEEMRRRMNDQLNLCASYGSQAGFGDFDVYIGARNIWDYELKCREIYTDIRVGMLAPTGVKQDKHILGSIPFGGDGHWGIYASNWTQFELKEDWKTGFLLRVSRRFNKVQCMRMPVKGEPLPFAPEIGDVKVDPAPTLVFAPYVGFENLREGLGLRVVYTLRHHGTDYWCDARKCENAVPVDLKAAQEITEWNSDYFTLNAFYDFGRTKIDRELSPIIYAAWDIPSAMLATKRVPQTHRVSLGVQLTF